MHALDHHASSLQGPCAALPDWFGVVCNNREEFRGAAVGWLPADDDEAVWPPKIYMMPLIVAKPHGVTLFEGALRQREWPCLEAMGSNELDPTVFDAHYSFGADKQFFDGVQSSIPADCRLVVIPSLVHIDAGVRTAAQPIAWPEFCLRLAKKNSSRPDTRKPATTAKKLTGHIYDRLLHEFPWLTEDEVAVSAAVRKHSHASATVAKMLEEGKELDLGAVDLVYEEVTAELADVRAEWMDEEDET